jgi:hypothetical protein
MKQIFFSSLILGLLTTSCVPRAELSIFSQKGGAKHSHAESENLSHMMVKHQIQKVGGLVPQTRVVNMVSNDTVYFTEKTYLSEIKEGELVEFTVYLKGHVSKVYMIDTRNMEYSESVTILVTKLQEGIGSDTLGVIVGGSEIIAPTHFNNQPTAQIHPLGF